MSDIPKPNNPTMVSNRSSFSGFLHGFLGLKSSSSAGIESVTSSSSIDGKEHDSNVKRNDTWAGFSGGEGQTRSVPANSDKTVVLESDETSYGRPPRPTSCSGVREKVTWSFFNRNGEIMEEIRPESVSASKQTGPIIDSLPSAQSELLPSSRPGMQEAENNLMTSESIQKSDEPLPPVKRKYEFFWSIMDQSTVANIRELNMLMPQST